MRRLLVVTARSDGFSHPAAPAHNADAVCILDPPGTPPRKGRRRLAGDDPAPLTAEQWLWRQLVRLSACIGRETLPRGGVLLHSALALLPPLPSPDAAQSGEGPGVRGEAGVLLAGRSGVGKSTASRRLPPPWRALADDVTLVARDAHGAFWAHPFPSWSRFFGEEAGDGSDRWDVQQAVPLRAIFLLEQGSEDRAGPMGAAHAVCMLAELARQTSTHLMDEKPLDEIAAFNRQRFENLCALARAVPAYALQVSLKGTFWQVIEQTIL